MTHSLVEFLSGYVDAIFDDIAYAYSDKRELDRDRSRVQLLLSCRGSRVVTIDMPTIAKYLERSLAIGRLDPTRVFLMGRRAKSECPKFLGHLFLKLFDDSGLLRSCSSPEIVFAIRQLCLCCKKLRLTCPEELTYDEVKNFFALEEEIRVPSLPWGDMDLGISEDVLSGHHICDDPDRFFRLSVQCREALYVFQRISDTVSSELGNFDDESDTELPKHGPGAVSNGTRRESKYRFPEWPEKLDSVFAFDRYVGIHSMDSSVPSYPGLQGDSLESPSKLIAVPKTQKGPRLIAAEPIQNQWIQQLIWSQLEQRLASTSLSSSVNFRSQMANQVRAKSGSADGYYATIDLSSASDRLSCWTVERTFRRNIPLLRRLNASRTPYLRNSIDRFSPNLIRLRKFAAMGSACTFPVQSLVYALLAVAVTCNARYPTKNDIRRSSSEVQVFGDDIVLPAHRSEILIEALEYLGLKVNKDKSFLTGSFRESCGFDAFKGECVTPAYLLDPSKDATVSNIPGFLAVINNHHRKGLWNAAEFLRGGIRRFENFVPISSVLRDDSPLSLHSFCGDRHEHLRCRWSDSLHRFEWKVLRPFTKVRDLATDGYHQLLKFLHEPNDPTIKFGIDGCVKREPISRSLMTQDERTSFARPGWAPILYS